MIINDCSHCKKTKANIMCLLMEVLKHTTHHLESSLSPTPHQNCTISDHASGSNCQFIGKTGSEEHINTTEMHSEKSRYKKLYRTNIPFSLTNYKGVGDRRGKEGVDNHTKSNSKDISINCNT